MPSSIGLFSRRKNSEDKALRAALSPQVNPYIYNNPTSSAPALQPTPIPQPPHSAPLSYKKKNLPKPPPIVSGFASETAGLVFAPHLTRARTSNFDNPSGRENGHTRPKPLIRSSSSGPGRRTKSFDHRPPMEPYQEVPPIDNRRCQSSSQLPQEPVPTVNFSRAGTPRSRVPSAQGLYSPVLVYPVSPPLSPEVDGEGEGRIERGTEGRHGSYNARTHGHGVSGEGGLGDGRIGGAEPMTEGYSQELAALRFGSQGLETASGSSSENLENTRRGRREYELVNAVKGKEKELEFLRSNSHGYLEQIAAMEQALAQKDEELESARVRIYELGQYQARNRNTPMMMEGISEMGLADIGRKLMEEIRRRERAEKLLAESLVKAKTDMDAVIVEEEKKRGEIRAVVWREFENTLHHEERMRDEVERRSRENLQSVLGEEERRRAELNWVYGEKIEKIENLRRNDLEEFQNSLAGLREEKERLEKQIWDNVRELEESRQSIRTQREANEELLEMTKKINTRLGEEKRKNRQLEEKMTQITEDALNSVSGANREVFMLKNVIEDKDTKIKFFETELAAVKKDNKAMEEAWAGMEAELEEARKTLLDRDERIKDLEEGNIGVADRLEAYRKELDEFKQKVTGEEQQRTPELEDVKISELKEDIELYKKDVRVYKKDVKKRDNHIKDLKRSVAELESLLESKTLETKVLQDALDTQGSYREGSPSSTDSSGSESNSPLRDEAKALKQKVQMYEKEYRAIHDDYEALRKKHDLFVSQQAMIITEIDKQLTRARKEKDAVEAAATRQLKKMQHGFLQLSQTAVAGQLAGIGGAAAVKKYHEVPLPPLPAGLENPSSPKRSNTGLKRTGSKIKVGKRRSSGEKGRVDLSPAVSPVAGMEAVRVVGEEEDLRERAKLEKAMSVVHEPDSEEEEVIEW